MSEPTTSNRVQPVIIVQPGAMSAKDIKRMNKAGITVVEAKNPESIRFLDAPRTGWTEQEVGAINLCRTILSRGQVGTQYYRYQIAELYVECLLSGGALKTVSAVPSVPETKAIK